MPTPPISIPVDLDFFDQNFEDDGVLAANFSTGDPEQFPLLFPADASEPDQAIEVWQMRVYVREMVVLGLAGMGVAGTIGSAVEVKGQWSISAIDYDEETEDAPAMRGELKQSIWEQPVMLLGPVSDDTDDAIRNPYHEGIDVTLRFTDRYLKPKPLTFITNPEMMVDLTGSGSILDISAWNVRMWYRVKKVQLSDFERLFVWAKQNLSA